MTNLINESIQEFIGENQDSNLIVQLCKANEQRDRAAFTQLLKVVRDTISLLDEVAYYEDQIKLATIELKERRRLLNNALGWHKIRRK